MSAFPLHKTGSPRPRRRAGGWSFGRPVDVLAGLAGILAFASPGFANPIPDITGLWVTHDGEGAIEIRPCGDQRCGRIAWMKDPKGADGKPPLDRNNPDPALRSRTICGLQIISGLKSQPDGAWGRGKVYDPDSGNTYDMEIRRDTAETIKATGYAGFQILGQTKEWRQAPKNLGRCDDPPAELARPPKRPS
jgi:uncharacterized protein (DUF2147 family)